jgi:hypothetical protein
MPAAYDIPSVKICAELRDQEKLGIHKACRFWTAHRFWTARRSWKARRSSETRHSSKEQRSADHSPFSFGRSSSRLLRPAAFSSTDSVPTALASFRVVLMSFIV